MKITAPAHPDHELEKNVEAMVESLRSVSMMDQLAVVNVNTIREAIERTNYMVTNRVRASISIKFKKDKGHHY